MRLLVGLDEADGGTIVRARERRLGYLAQDAAESGPQTLRAAFDEAMARGNAQEWEMRATLNRFDFAPNDLDRPRGLRAGDRARSFAPAASAQDDRRGQSRRGQRTMTNGEFYLTNLRPTTLAS